MVRLLLIGLLLNSCLHLFSQSSEIDSLKALLDSTSDYTEQVELLSKLSEKYASHYSDSTIFYATRCLNIARQSGKPQLLAEGLMRMGIAMNSKRQEDLARIMYDSSMLVAKLHQDTFYIAQNSYHIARLFQKDKNNLDRAIKQYEVSLDLFQNMKDTFNMCRPLRQLAVCFFHQGELDKSLNTNRQSFELASASNNSPVMVTTEINTGAVYSKQGDYKSSVAHLQNAINIAKTSKSIAGERNANRSLGVTYYRMREYEKALHHLDIALKLSESMGDKSGIAKSLLSKGIAYSRQGSYEKAIAANIKSAEIMEDLQDDKGRSNAYANIGKIYRQHDQQDKALGFYEKALEIKQRINDKDGISVIYNNIGNIQYDKNNYLLAIENYNKSYRLSVETGDKSRQALCLNNLGNTYFRKNELNTALEYLFKGLDIYDSTNDEGGISRSLNLISQIYLEFKKNPEYAASAEMNNITYAEIESMLLRAYDLAHQSNDFYDQKNITLTLSEFYKSRKNFDKALMFQDQYLSIKDSIYANEKLTAITEMQTRFETENKEKENEFLKANNELIKSRNYWYFYTAIALTGLLFTGLLNYLQVRKVKQQLEVQNNTIEYQNEQLTQLNKTKDRFFGIIAHDLKSPLIAMQGLGKRINFLLRNNEREQLLALGNQVDNTSTKLNNLLDNLLNWASLQTGNIPYHPEALNLREVAEDVVDLFKENAKAKGVELEMEISPELEVHADERAINTILRNLLSNAVKFTPAGGKVSLKTLKQNNTILVCLEDTGQGMTPQQLKNLFTMENKSMNGTAGEKGTGLGLILCKELIDLNKGQLQVKSIKGEGSTFEFTLPALQ